MFVCTKKILLALSSRQLNLYNSFPVPNSNIKTGAFYNFTAIIHTYRIYSYFSSLDILIDDLINDKQITVIIPLQ